MTDLPENVGHLYRNKKLLNINSEILIGDRVISKNDVLLIYIDRGMGIKNFGKNLGCGYKKANKILENFRIPKNQYDEMTPRRLRVLRYIAYHQKKYNESPLIKDIAQKLNLTSRSVVYHIQKLNHLGFLEKRKYKREIIIKNKGLNWCNMTELFNSVENTEGGIDDRLHKALKKLKKVR